MCIFATMKGSILKEDVNPELLRWAREQAGIDIDESKGATVPGTQISFKRIQAFEDGKDQPTYRQLMALGKVYFRPTTIFYLSRPPQDPEIGIDFRTLRSQSRRANAIVDALKRDIVFRQSILKDFLQEVEEIRPLSFVHSYTQRHPRELARRIQRDFNFHLDEFRKKDNATKAFEYLRECVEEAGVFVMLIGHLGSSTQESHKCSVDMFRGFVLSDEIAPLIVINANDTKAARSFTLLHELAHLYLGNTSISGAWTPSIENNIEKFCNQVAASVLLPEQNIPYSNMEDIKNLSKQYKVSRAFILYKLFLEGKINHTQWQDCTKRMEQQSQTGSARGGGGNYYATRRNYLGHRILHVVKIGVRSGNLSYTAASAVLGTSPINVEKCYTY